MRPYNGPGIIKQLAHLRENYKGKNINGGRKCRFTRMAIALTPSRGVGQSRNVRNECLRFTQRS